MKAPPLAELYDLLRADGFAIGVDDHLRIGQLITHEAVWTIDKLRIAVAALVVSDPKDRDAFDACWERWVSSAKLPRPSIADPPTGCTEPPSIVVVKSFARRAELSGRPAGVHAFLRAFARITAVVLAIALIARSDTEQDGCNKQRTGSGEQVVGSGSGQPGSAEPPSETSSVVTRVAVALGAIMLMITVIANVLGARARRRFAPGPWRYTPAVPPPARSVLPRNAIEDAAADLTWQVPGVGQELDVARSVAATVERGGLPILVHHRAAASPRYLVLEDTAGGAGRWKLIYDELMAGLAREGVEFERYTFTANPERCLRPDGTAYSLVDLVDHADGLIVIGDGEAAVDPLDGTRAPWLASLRLIACRLWINPVPPVRWTAGARAIAEDTPMEHGVARALAALHTSADRHTRPARPFPAVIDRAPGTASAVVALRAALGESAFRLVAAVALSGPPTVAAARWMAELLALELNEQDWLAIVALPWFGTHDWPEGLREGLQRALAADAPGVTRAVAAVSDWLFAASAPPPNSAAHLAWRLEGARRAAQRGDRAAARQSLNRLAATPLAHQALGVRKELGLPDRASRVRGLLMVAVPVAIILAAFAPTNAFLPSVCLASLVAILWMIGTGKLWSKRRPSTLYEFQPSPQPMSLTGQTPQMSLAGQMRLLDIDEIPSQFKIGSAGRRWFAYIVSGILAVSVAAGVTFLIIRSTRESTPTVGSVHLESVPSGAEVIFDGTRLTDRTPLTIDGAPVGTRHTITIELPHYAPYTETIDIPKDGREISIVAQLASIAVDATIEPPIDAPTAPTRADIVALSRFGFFSINADAKTQIYVDNRLIGDTPLTRIPMSPGPHKIKAIGPRGKSKLINITIYGGRDTDEGTIAW